MAVQYCLTPELRRKLKEPLGTLIRGSFNETMKRFKDVMRKENPPYIISVGDTISKNILQNNIYPHVTIVDNRVMRKSIRPIPLKADKVIRIKSPPGAITREAVEAIQEAVKSKRTVKIVVEGEEDLLTLIAVLCAPENSLVVYGQPHEGIVVVKVTQEKKAEVAEILKAMENFRKAE